MIVEIRGAGFVNKGAELMLRAILCKLREAYPDVGFTMDPSPEDGTQPYSRIVSLGIYPKVSLWLFGVQIGQFAWLIPKRLRERYGLILEGEVDVVVDASGFAYSDEFSELATRRLARSVGRWKKNGSAVILMPQALGPFRSRSMRRYMANIVENSDLVFARESTSYDHLTGAVGPSDKVRKSPDFTNILSGYVPEWFDPSMHKVCLVPNYRMIDKTDDRASRAYVPFLVRCADYLISRGKRPFILVHEGPDDVALAKKISESVGGLDILQESDPVAIKGILGACEATIGSRYHGLVSALSQGVPSLGAGWSHKYELLFEDYNFPEGMVSVFEEESALFMKIDRLVDTRTRTALSEQLQKSSLGLRRQTGQMWDNIIESIDAAMIRRAGMRGAELTRLPGSGNTDSQPRS